MSTIKTIWQCRNGLANYLNDNPETLQNEVLQKTLEIVINDLLEATRITQPTDDNIPFEWNDEPVTSGDSDEVKIQHLNFVWDMMAFSLGIYPRFSTMPFTDKAIKIYKIAYGDPLLRARMEDELFVVHYLRKNRKMDSSSLSEPEKSVVEKIYGESVEVASFDDFLTYMVQEEPECCV